MYTSDLQSAECARLLSPCPAPSVMGCQKQLGKQHGRQPSCRAKGLVGSVSAHSWLKCPMLERWETLKKLRYIWAMLSAFTDWISKHQDGIKHFSFNKSLHVNDLKFKANIQGRKFSARQCTGWKNFGLVSKWHVLICETTNIDTCLQAMALSGSRAVRGRAVLSRHHEHFCLFLFFAFCVLSFPWHRLSHSFCDHSAWGASSRHRNRKMK